MRSLTIAGMLLLGALPAWAGPGYSSSGTYYRGQGPVAQTTHAAEWNRQDGDLVRKSSSSFTNLKTGAHYKGQSTRTYTPGAGRTVERSVGQSR